MPSLPGQGIQVYNILLEPVEKEHSTVDWDISDAEKGGYEHFMFKEIMEQPEAIRKTITPRIKDDRVVLDDIDLSADYVKNISKFYIIACGSSLSCGHGGQICPGKADSASRWRWRWPPSSAICAPIVDKNTLVIVISQSGETLDTMAALREAKRLGRAYPGHRQRGGQLHRQGSRMTCIYTWAGPEIAVATTKAYSTQLAVLDLLCPVPG